MAPEKDRQQRSISSHSHSITIECMGCHEPNSIEVRLPTAIKCEHCGMIFDARITLMERRTGVHEEA